MAGDGGAAVTALVFPADEWELILRLYRLLYGGDAVTVLPVRVPFGAEGRIPEGEATLMRLEPNPAAAGGEAVPFDPEHPQEFAARAGAQFLGQDGDVAWCLDEAGNRVPVYPGTLAVLVDGDDKVIFAAPGNVGRPGSRWVTA